MRVLFLFLGDVALLYLSLMVTLYIDKSGVIPKEYLLNHFKAFSFIFPFYLLLFYIEGLYSFRQLFKQTLSISLIRSLVLSVMVTYIFFYLFPLFGITPKTNGLILGLLSFAFIFSFRKSLNLLFSTTLLSRKVLFLSDSDTAKELKQHVNETKELGFLVADSADTADIIVFDHNNYQESANQLLEFVKEKKILIELSRFSEKLWGKIPIHEINESWFINFCAKGENRFQKFLKWFLDFLVSFLLTLIVIPVFIILLPILLLVSGRPLFYSQTRTGKGSKPFKIYKLRTMTVDAEKKGAQWSTPNDARITKIGKFLRITRLDELPQLYNILKGDMSLVGPRPERPEIIASELSPNIPFYNLRHLVKPGVTGWAQVNFRYGYSKDDSLEKLQYDLYYIKNQNLILDIKIILKTVKTVLTGMGH